MENQVGLDQKVSPREVFALHYLREHLSAVVCSPEMQSHVRSV